MILSNTKKIVFIASALTLLLACSGRKEVNGSDDVKAINRAINNFHHLNDKSECPSVQKLVSDGYIDKNKYGITALKGKAGGYKTEITREGDCVAFINDGLNE